MNMIERNMPAIGTTLETVIVFTTRMEELARFYQAGLQLGDFNLSPQHMGLQVGHLYLGFDQVDEVQTGDGVTLWFTVDDLAATYERLVGMGAAVKYGPSHKPWGGYLAAVYDPDGNLIGLSERVK